MSSPSEAGPTRPRRSGQAGTWFGVGCASAIGAAVVLAIGAYVFSYACVPEPVTVDDGLLLRAGESGEGHERDGIRASAEILTFEDPASETPPGLTVPAASRLITVEVRVTNIGDLPIVEDTEVNLLMDREGFAEALPPSTPPLDRLEPGESAVLTLYWALPNERSINQVRVEFFGDRPMWLRFLTPDETGD